MTKPIRRVAVLGAGTMGSGIAAHVANAGLPVLLLDIVPPNLGDKDSASKAKRNAFADGAVKRMLKSKPASFMHKGNTALVTTGNLEDDLDKIADCDLVIEAVLERLDIKRPLFERIEKIVEGKDVVVASNTSGLRISEMLVGRSSEFCQNFLITHFFNPPRYMKLLELVAGVDTSPAVLARVEQFGKETLGKGIVLAKDSPNFVANRIGTHGMLTVLHEMDKAGLVPEDIDAICGAPMGRPKSAIFRTADVVGIDVLGLVAGNCYEALTEDEDRDVFKLPEWVQTMIDNKVLGNKTKGGFYKKTKEGIQTYDPGTGDYRARGGDAAIKSTTKAIARTEDLGKRLRKLIADEGQVGTFAWTVISRSLAYTARRVGEISDDVEAIDNAMKWGYAWDIGPFEMWDALGFADTYDRMKSDGLELPESVARMRDAGAPGFYREDGAIYDLVRNDYIHRDRDPREASLTVMRQGDSAVLANPGAEAWDLGDGILGVTFKTKQNSLDNDVIALLGDAIDRAEQDFRGVVLANQGPNFCVGANLFGIVAAAGQKQWDQLRDVVGQLQATMQRMKYSTVPVVAAPYGFTFGGGLEICLASDAVQAAAETYSGLVEVGVGLIPGGAGNVNLLWRAFEGIPDGTHVSATQIVAGVFQKIATAQVATSAQEAKAKGYFRKRDGESFDKARLLYEAKARAIGMAESGYHPPVPKSYVLPGESGIATVAMSVDSMVAGGYASEHDQLIAGKLATVLCGGASGAAGPVTEERMLELEREAFVSLAGEPKSQERMQHMLMKNKPLRN